MMKLSDDRSLVENSMWLETLTEQFISFQVTKISDLNGYFLLSSLLR